MIATALGRTKEYRAHYDAASWLSHPSIGALENMLEVDSEGILHDHRSPLASALPGMALSLARLTYSRVLRRAFEIIGCDDRRDELSEFMRLRGIEETGVMEAVAGEDAS